MSTLKTNNIQHVDLADPSILLNSDGSVSIAGTVSYEDVTNVDSVGIITARKQLHVGTGVSIAAGGLNVTAGITTVQALQATSGTFAKGSDVGNIIQMTGADTTSELFEAGITSGFVQLTATYQAGGDNSAGFVFRTRNGSSGTAERIRIGANGTIEVQDSVTLSTNAPTKKGKIRISGTSDASNDGGIEFHTSSGGGGGYGSRITADASGNMHFLTRVNSASWSERFRIDTSGHIVPGTDSTYDLGLTGTRFRNAYVDTYYGDGSNLTGVNETTINTNGANRLIIGSATANTLAGVSNLIFDGNNLKVGNTADPSDYNQTDIILGTHSGHSGMTILSSPSHGGFIMFSDNDGGGTNAYRGQIEYNHSDDYMRFLTSSTERMRIRGWGDVNISNKLNVAGITTTTALKVNGATTPVTIIHTGGNAMNLTRSSKTLGFNANYGASDVKSQIDVSSGMGLALSVADNEKIRMTSGGQLNLGGNFTQTSSALSIYGGSGGSGIFNGLEVKHANTSTSTGGGTGDGPAILLNGYYSSAEWQFAKICSVNSGSGYGADLQIHVHPSNGTQGASLVKAVSIVGNGTGGNITIHAGTLYTTYDGDSMYGAQINDSKTSGTHIQFQRQGYNNGNITHTTNSCAYNTTGSDRTLKKNFEDWTEDTLTLFKNLKPQKFNFTIEDDGAEKTKGYIAQDLVDSFPEAYPKEVKSDKYMFNPSGMVPYLMKALQEEIAKREALEVRIAALEG